ncbi:toxin-antitoxin system HicB family antitoxin [Robertmurraya sp. DFI.2.37]|nr:toxin-antitoxin system HicB family antitoxin [Robertmurraya sp. DFI.2.37]MDF1507646.1 toxin-antitoxin system HicB family antitoxin [Robertmurraya sp. DFI.2.37]
MTNNDKKRFTLRLNSDICKKVEKEAKELGLTQNAYIVMVLHKELKEKV